MAWNINFEGGGIQDVNEEETEKDYSMRNYTTYRCSAEFVVSFKKEDKQESNQFVLFSFFS